MLLADKWDRLGDYECLCHARSCSAKRGWALSCIEEAKSDLFAEWSVPTTCKWVSLGVKCSPFEDHKDGLTLWVKRHADVALDLVHSPHLWRWDAFSWSLQSKVDLLKANAFYCSLHLGRGIWSKIPWLTTPPKLSTLLPLTCRQADYWSSSDNILWRFSFMLWC